jgi:hypothetical protein
LQVPADVSRGEQSEFVFLRTRHPLRRPTGYAVRSGRALRIGGKRLPNGVRQRSIQVRVCAPHIDKKGIITAIRGHRRAQRHKLRLKLLIGVGARAAG